MLPYLVIFTSVIVGAMGAFIIGKFGSSFGFMDVCNVRSSHAVNTSRAGGIGILIVFLISGLFWVGNPYFIIPIALAGLLGLAEDRFSLSSKFRLIFQLVLSVFLIFQFVGVASFPQIFLSVFWIVFITGTANFYNFMDGIDGIAGLTGVVYFALFAIFTHLFLKEPTITFLSLALSSACGGFLLFNFPRAKVFMGDVGSILLGFASSSLIFKASTDINIFLCLTMFLCTFYADSLVTLYYRWRRKENLMVAHRSHLYQYMSNELKIPHWKVSLGYAMVQFVFGLLAIVCYRESSRFQLLLTVTFGILFILTYNKIKTITVKVL